MGFLSIESSFSSSFDRPYSSSIDDRSGKRNGTDRAKVSLHASVKSTNKNARRRKQKQARKNQTSAPLSEADRRAKSPGRSLSEEELQSHLNSKINWGTNGPVGPRARTRGMVKRNSDNSGDTSTTDHISDQQREQQFFLRQLNNRPTLVLNADYMVSRTVVQAENPFSFGFEILVFRLYHQGLITVDVVFVCSTTPFKNSISHWDIYHWVSGHGRMRSKQFSRGVSP